MKQAQDIISLPIELTDKVTDSKFRLVHIAAQRVRQLSAGSPIQVATQSIKDSTTALEETLFSERLKFLVGEEAQKAKEEFKKQQEQARQAEELSAKEEEIRKELSVYLSESQEEGEAAEEVASEEPAAGETEEDQGDQAEPAEAEE